MDTQQQAVDLVLAERQRQDGKWGVQSHHLIGWEPILHEETGEVSKEVNRIYFGGQPIESSGYLEEVVQVAAVALAMIECELRRRNQAQMDAELLANWQAS